MATTITANGINFPDGSAGSPSIGGTDTNTGLFTGSDIVGFATGGSERLRIDASGNVNIANDSGKLQLGTGADLQSWHNGTHSLIKNNTGRLYVLSDDVWFKDKDDGDLHAKFVHDGQVELYYDNSKKLETVTGGVYVYGDIVGGVGGTGNISLGDSSKFIAGSGNDLQLYHDGTSSFIDTATGHDLYIRSTQGNRIRLEPRSGENGIQVIADGAVELYHDNSKKFETYSDGISVSGRVQADGHCFPYSDNNSDLGLSGNRWQDLYLSGQIYLGGTGASNSLEDYEEGTFTPSFGGDSGNGTYTYNRQAGKYTKIGNAVFFQLYMTVNAVNSHSSGNTMVNGLPFTPTGSNDYNGCCIGYYHNFNGIVPSQALVDVGQTRLYLYKNNTSSNISHSSPTDVQNNTSLIISGHYYAA